MQSTTRFNEAPIHESGKYLRLQHEDGVQLASMRPRFMNRGSDLHAGVRGRIDPASMRPRFMNRGSVAASLGSRDDSALQ